jgi:hypothetical protein
MTGWRYRAWSRFLHRFNYHHTTTCYPDGDIQDWCEWCGLRMTRVRSNVLGLRGDDAVAGRSKVGGEVGRTEGREEVRSSELRASGDRGTEAGPC